MTARAWRRWIGVFVLVHLVVVAAVVYGWLPTLHDAWWFDTGGDENAYFELGRALAHGGVVRSIFTLGYPLLLAPFIRMAGAWSVNEIAQPVVLLQACVMMPLSVWAVAWLGRRFTGSGRAGLMAAGLWTAMPGMWWAGLRALRTVYPALQRGYDPQRQFTCLLGMQVIADTWSMLLVLTAVWRMCRALDAPSLRRAALAGLAAGCALLTRPENIAVIGVGLLMCAGRRRWRDAVVYAAVAGAVMVPQLWYNAAVEGAAWKFAWVPDERTYLASHARLYLYPYPAVFAPANVGYFGAWLLERLPRVVPLLAASAGCAWLAGVAALWRHGQREGARWTSMWVLAYAAVLLPYYGFPSAVIRYLIPVYPAVCIGIAALADRLVTRPG